MKYCQALVSAVSRQEANEFSDSLVRSKLIAGSLITQGDSRYWWEGEIVEKTYWNVQAFTLFEKNRQ